MNKSLFAFIAYFTIAQYAHAAVAPFYESVLEYEAITSALGTNPNFQSIINPSEVIIDIKRMTQQINSIGEVNYEIVTGTSLANEDKTITESKDNNLRKKSYIAKINVARNPGIGRKIITLLSIIPASSQN